MEMTPISAKINPNLVKNVGRGALKGGEAGVNVGDDELLNQLPYMVSWVELQPLASKLFRSIGEWGLPGSRAGGFAGGNGNA